MRAPLTAADLFAGAGGFSTGAAMAGLKVRWAVNHWSLAIDVHQANHPGVRHEPKDIFDAQPKWFADMPPVDVLLASPACQGHSEVATGAGKRGATTGHEMLRSTAFTILTALDGFSRARSLPRIVIVENVRGFMRWSSDPDALDGSLFNRWLGLIESYGYKTQVLLLDAADLGVPQNRERLFVVASLGGEPRIPVPSGPHVGFQCCAELDKGDWIPVADLAKQKHKGAWRRSRLGRENHPDDDAFLIHHDSYNKGRSLERPIGTITATPGQWAVVKRGRKGDLYRLLLVEEYRRAMAFPKGYALPVSANRAVELLGNAVCPPVAKYVIEHAVETIR